jgi:hypothetical protein
MGLILPVRLKSHVLKITCLDAQFRRSSPFSSASQLQ